MYVSLGSSCDVYHHIKRLNLDSISSPFNSSSTNHKVLLECILSDFSDIFVSDVAKVVCYRTGFSWGHRKLDWLNKDFLRLWNHHVESFTTLKDKDDVVFVRKSSSLDNFEEEQQTLLDYLGFSGYRGDLLFGVSVPNSSPFFTFDQKPDDKSNSWKGCADEWDKFILSSPRYRI